MIKKMRKRKGKKPFFYGKLQSRKAYDYSRSQFSDVVIMRLRHIKTKHLKLLIDLTYRRELRTSGKDAGRWVWVYNREEWLTAEAKASIANAGYIPCKGFHDSIAWSGIPTYVRLDNAKEFDISKTDKNGEPLYPLDTAITLNDVMMSSATEDFIRGLSTARKPVGTDIQKIAMIAIIGIGVVLGIMMMR